MEVIAELSASFLRDMKQRMSDMTHKCLVFGDVFLKLVPVLKIYSFYLRNYDSGQKLLEKRL